MKSIREIAEKIIEEMGGDPVQICTGDCPEFAKELVRRAGRGQIVSNLAKAMSDELEGFDVITPEAHFPNPDRFPAASHCWVLIDGKYYDAYNPEGVSDESELSFRETY